MFQPCPIFHPTNEEFTCFEAYVNDILVPNCAAKYGAALVVPPESWLLRSEKTYDDILNRKRIIVNPIHQSVEKVNSENGMFSYHNLPWAETNEGRKWCKENKNRAAVKITKEKNIISTVATLTINEFKKLTSADSTEKCDDDDKFWQLIHNEKLDAIYGTDVPHSLMDETAGSWNLNNLTENTLLQKVKNTMYVPGIRRSYLYFGSRYSTFAWHSENIDLPSINYLHFGDEKIWYVISAEQSKKFELVMYEEAKKLYPECSTPSRHNPLIIDPTKLAVKYQIRITRVEQCERMFVVTFPYAYHCGYNTGFYIAEAANFAIEYWIPFGITAERCDCYNDIAFPIGEYIEILKGENYYQRWCSNQLTYEGRVINVPQVGKWRQSIVKVRCSYLG